MRHARNEIHTTNSRVRFDGGRFASRMGNTGVGSLHGLVLSFLAAISPLASNAATYTRYIGNDNGDFWSASNWNNGLPSSSDYVARLDSGYATPCTITMTNAPGATFSYLLVDSGEWTLLLRGARSFGGDYDNGGIRVSAGAKLTIVGGVITNTCFQASSGGQIVFDNVVTRDCVTHRRQDGNSGDREAYVFNGGKCNFRTMYMRLYQQASFGSGDFTFGSIHGWDRYGEGKQSKLSSYVSVTGGRLSVTGDNKIDAPCSIGITASGNGWYRNSVENGNHWLADRGTYAWRVEDRGLIETPGIYLATGYDYSTGRVEVAGGRFRLKGGFGGNGVDSHKRSSAVILDGGVLDCDFAANGTLSGTITNTSSSAFLCVGANGGCLRNRNGSMVTIDRWGLSNAPGVAAPGDLSIKGYGKIYLNQSVAGTFSGKTIIRGLVHSDMSSCALGSGDIEIADGGCLYTSGNAVNNAVTFSGASYIWTDNASGRMSIPSLTRKDDGILILRSNASRTVYGTEANARYLAVGNAPALRSNGLPVDPVILMSSEPDNGIVEAHLVNWDAVNGRFVGAAYTSDILDGAGKVVYQNGATNISQNLSVGALVLRGTVAGGGKTITVGDGEGPAMVVLNPNSRGSSSDVSNWTLAFGSSRGVVSGGTKVSGVDNGCAKWNGYITGSAGVDFAFVDTGGLILYRKQSWTGGTRVMSGEVLLMSSGSYVGGFPDGEVAVVGGERSGGSVRFMTAATHAQHYTISGFGAAYTPTNKKGALSIEKDVTLSGRITLANDAMVGVADGYAGTLTGGMDGGGDLYLGSPVRKGALLLSGGINIAGDLHINTCVTNSGAIDLGGRFLYVDGTLVFNNSSDITVNAKVIGDGKVVLAGTGKVDFSDISVFDGVIDLCGNSATIGALNGLAEVTNSVDTAAALTVAGTSEAAYFGTISADVDLVVGGTFLLGAMTDMPSTIGLSLAGGTLGLYGDATVSSLAGHGAVLGCKLTVTSATSPDGENDTAMTFETCPELTSLDDAWKLHRVGLGADIRRRYGFIMSVR